MTKPSHYKAKVQEGTYVSPSKYLRMWKANYSAAEAAAVKHCCITLGKLPWNNATYKENRFQSARALAKSLYLNLVILERLGAVVLVTGEAHMGFWGIMEIHIQAQHKPLFDSCLFPTPSYLRPPKGTKSGPQLAKYKTACKNWQAHGFKEQMDANQDISFKYNDRRAAKLRNAWAKRKASSN
jgi:hypothetical protein